MTNHKCPQCYSLLVSKDESNFFCVNAKFHGRGEHRWTLTFLEGVEFARTNQTKHSLLGTTVKEPTLQWAIIRDDGAIQDISPTAEQTMEKICNRNATIPATWERIFSLGFKLVRVRAQFTVEGVYNHVNP